MTAAPARELAVMAALVEPSRRAIMQHLTSGPASASRLAERMPLTRQALVKHLAALEGAGLVARERRGREHVFAAQPEALIDTAQWLESLARSWQQQLGALKRAAEAQAQRR
ncbi:ArsR/SmtB family transcription factor [Gryllotalpicola protaetiae]|uniref:ArsR family transcriptional regulator n=1 Tax=Gryllotalpicola protaetiae TaxID=2419771 RepID=A0A387BQH8_9MICO|nr:metalloregulator ArsR/SmtB family transcription factor [Gryllotalpicola protaetiae]AYG04792.1 ArsR family transcriptional regulator [Gryllotalpicola protaetiae]